MSAGEGGGANSRSAVRRAVRVLGAFTAQPRWGVRELASHLEVSKSGLHRTLQEMAADGLVHVDEDGSYEIGAELLRLASDLLRATGVTRVAHEYLIDATRTTGETSILVAYDSTRQQMIAIDDCQSSHPIQFRGALQDWTDLHLSASGWGILAFLPPSERERYFSRERRGPRGRAVTERTLKKRLDKIRTTGWSISHGERVPETSGVCAPIFDGRDRIVAGIVIVWPNRAAQPDADLIGRTCCEVAGRISIALGSRRSSK